MMFKSRAWIVYSLFVFRLNAPEKINKISIVSADIFGVFLPAHCNHFNINDAIVENILA